MFCPTKLKVFYKEFQGREFNLLDVGCGNHVVQIFKKWFPQARYYGIDREVYNNSPEDFARMEAFYKLDLEESDLLQIPDEGFDMINMAHVLEHVHRGLDVLDKLLGNKIAKLTGKQLSILSEHPVAMQIAIHSKIADDFKSKFRKLESSR